MKRLLLLTVLATLLGLSGNAKIKNTITETITVNGKEIVVREDIPLAPDFTLPSIDGTKVTLSDYKGKWVVLDFWGSWCPWCVKGIPEMKEIYAELSPKLEIIGIDCKESAEAWKDAVKKYELPWVNVINNTSNDVAEEYEISGYPTKVIIDPFGGIHDVVIGEDPVFYEILREVVK